MAKVLSDEAVAHFRRRGYHPKLRALPADEAADLRARLERFEAGQGGALRPGQRNKTHLLLKWLDDLIRDPRILDPIEDLLGPDILCWNTLLWIKEAGGPSFVSWHQDIKYWGLAGGEVVTAWLALSPATAESGCMRVMPGSHLGPVLAHADRYDAANMLTRGQEISDPMDESKAVSMPLGPGEMSLHDVRLAHASGPNRSADRRIGVSIHYMPTRARQSAAAWDSAALVRGADAYGHFEHTPAPARDLDAAAVAFHERASRAVREILYRDAEHETGRL
ncbi:MAG: phytanoyl-CoA dioxygenase family protein [Alphaproteobacteria bacterium]